MTKEKVYDFGMLGKWSETTLKEQVDKSGLANKVPIIEQVYSEYHISYRNRADELEKKKVKQMLVVHLYRDIKELTDTYTKISSLRHDYHYYHTILRKLVG